MAAFEAVFSIFWVCAPACWTLAFLKLDIKDGLPAGHGELSEVKGVGAVQHLISYSL